MKLTLLLLIPFIGLSQDSTYFDGCNTCTVYKDGTKMCTTLACFEGDLLEPDSLHDRRYYDSLGKHWMIEYSYMNLIGKPVDERGIFINLKDTLTEVNTPQWVPNKDHYHWPAVITIIEYKGRNLQREVWRSVGIYSEETCPADNPRLWINRYLQTLNKK